MLVFPALSRNASSSEDGGSEDDTANAEEDIRELRRKQKAAAAAPGNGAAALAFKQDQQGPHGSVPRSYQCGCRSLTVMCYIAGCEHPCLPSLLAENRT